MRFVSLIPAMAVLFFSGAAAAQSWAEYVNRGDFFTINMPGDPTVQDLAYKTAKGTTLPAHVYTAQDQRGIYRLTVVDYSGAQAEVGTAVDEATKAIRAKGTVKYDGVNMLDMHRSWRITVETSAQRRILGEMLVSAANRLYISEAETTLTAPPPAQYQASLQILDANGIRIRNREVTPATPDEIVPVTPAAREADTAAMLKRVAGTWKSPGGSCDTAYLKAATRAKTARGEEALDGTVTNQGMVIKGLLIINGPRVGQLIDAKTDKVIFIFDPQDNKMDISALGPPAIGWPDVTLELCPGARG